MSTRDSGIPDPVSIPSLLYRMFLRPVHFQIASLAGIAVCIGLWVRAKTVPHDERANAERRALFVGLWPPTLWVIGQSLREEERRGR
jgi:hypothetical protein